MNRETFAIGMMESAGLGLLILIALRIGVMGLVSRSSSVLAEQLVVQRSWRGRPQGLSRLTSRRIGL